MESAQFTLSPIVIETGVFVLLSIMLAAWSIARKQSLVFESIMHTVLGVICGVIVLMGVANPSLSTTSTACALVTMSILTIWMGGRGLYHMTSALRFGSVVGPKTSPILAIGCATAAFLGAVIAVRLNIILTAKMDGPFLLGITTSAVLILAYATGSTLLLLGAAAMRSQVIKQHESESAREDF